MEPDYSFQINPNHIDDERDKPVFTNHQIMRMQAFVHEIRELEKKHGFILCAHALSLDVYDPNEIETFTINIHGEVKFSSV